MCGIGGVVLPPGTPVDPAIPARMIADLHHRGPDDHGWLSSRGGVISTGREPSAVPAGEIALVNARLAIIDLTEDGWQPMSTPDGRYHIVFNGEIYNYPELREKLEATGRTFHSQSDTEVLLHAIAEWGTGCLPALVGMFAFAFLDTKERKLTLGRDAFGIKPLYYTHWAGGLAFASETKVLLRLAGLERKLNPQRTYQYLRFGLTDHDGQTMIASLQQIPAAHCLEVSLDRPGDPAVPVRYWSPDPRYLDDLSFDQAAKRMRELFLESVRLHLRSDVPVGVAFSGGIDSAALLSSMRYLEGPSLDLHAFSYVADGRTISEESWIDLGGAAVNAHVHKVRPTPHELQADLDALIAAQDEPFRSTSVYAQYRVFRLAQEEGIKVTLDGQGADEILAGYRPYLAARIASCFRQGQIAEGLTLARNTWGLPQTNASRLLYQAGGYLLPSNLQATARKLVGAGLVPSWLDAQWFASRGVDTAAARIGPGPHILRAALESSVDTTSLPALLRYEDRNSMAHSVESRVPFLTPEFVTFCLSLPEDYLISKDGTSKAVFRKAMRGIVPDAVLNRRDKIGFETPELGWMRTLEAWVTQIIGSPTAIALGPLDHVAMRREWADILAGRKHFDSHVWRWVNLIRWAELNGVSSSE
ncbi:MAG: asparagine synthase (glutamine-hydrolyzing) [Tepidiformaceae bacterium]